MRTIVPVIMTTVLGLALMPASAATKHKRHTPGCHRSTATDRLHRGRVHSRSTRLPSRDGLHAVGNTNRL